MNEIEEVTVKINQKAKSAEEIANSLDEFYKQLGVKRISKGLKISHGDFVKMKNEKWIKTSDVSGVLSEWQKTHVIISKKQLRKLFKKFSENPRWYVDEMDLLEELLGEKLFEEFVKMEKESGLK